MKTKPETTVEQPAPAGQAPTEANAVAKAATPEKASPLPFDAGRAATELVAEMPSPTDSAIAEAQRAETEAAKRDKFGEQFNPAIHVAPDRFNVRGGFEKKRGVKPGYKNPRSFTPAPIDQNVANQKAQLELEARSAATVTVDSILSVGVLLGGKDWQPVRDAQTGDERATMIEAYTRYYIIKGVRDIPPGMAVLIVTTGYISRRLFTSPETRSRIAKFKEWAAGKYARWTMRKREKKNARFDNRDNNVRENNVGEGTGAQLRGAGD